MKEHKTRARLYNFKYGFGLILDNNIITDSHLVSYISPIQQDLPQIDFKVTIDNKSRYFNVDNPQSAINFWSTVNTCSLVMAIRLKKMAR